MGVSAALMGVVPLIKNKEAVAATGLFILYWFKNNLKQITDRSGKRAGHRASCPIVFDVLPAGWADAGGDDVPRLWSSISWRFSSSARRL